MKLILLLTLFGLDVIGLAISSTDLKNISKSYFRTDYNISEITRFKRETKNCGSTVELLNCDMAQPINLSPTDTNKIKATYTPGPLCNITSTVFHWTVLLDNGTDANFDDYYNKETFIIQQYTIGAGSHHVIVYVTEYEDIGEAGTITSDICQFNILVELPVAQITGGSEITVSSGQDFVVDGSKSIDMNVPPGEKGDLQYKWSCQVAGTQASSFCRQNLGTAASVVIPKNYALDGLTYTFTLFVRISLTNWQNATQIVHFKKGAAVIEVKKWLLGETLGYELWEEISRNNLKINRRLVYKCLKNCLPAVLKTNNKEELILKAVCTQHCEKIKPEQYEWTIDDGSFDYNANTHHGRNSDIFYVKENVLAVGRKYKISVSQTVLSGGASIEIEIHTPPKLDSCSVSPNSGEALKTQFIVACVYKQGYYMFELYSVKNNLEVLLDRGVKLMDMPLLLSPGAKVKVKMIDNYRFSDFKLIDVSVTASLTSTNPTDLDNQVQNKYLDEKSENSLDALLKAKKIDALLQATSSLIDELNSIGKTDQNKDVIKKYQMKALQYLEKVPLENGDRAKQVSAIATKLINEHITKPDPEISALGTSICKNAAKIDENRLKTERFPQSFSEEIKENAQVLTQCAQASTNPNLEIMETKDITDPPTPFPLLDVPVIVENYPDYVDDQNVSRYRQNFEISSNNLIEMCFINTKSLEITMVLEEEAKSIKANSFNVTVMKATGRKIRNSRIHSQGVTLIPSKNLGRSTSKVVITMCTCTKNPFWWTEKDEIQTSIAIIRFIVDNNIVKTFSKPFSIAFDVNNFSPSLIETHDGVTPRKPNDTNSEDEYDFEKISMYRIDVGKHQGFTVEFCDLSANDILEADDTKFKFSVYTLTCYNWISKTRTWEPACQSKSSTMKRIECECYHASTLAGRIVNNKVREEETILAELGLEVQASIIIFISVGVIFFLYCILLSCLAIDYKSEFKEKKVYFLSDVPSYYRYGYLIIIKTADKMNAGTTSNIMIKLYGSKSKSKEHVLNYPDPDKKLLQKNQEDWFFMATENYLGNIEKIDLWFDSIGYRPTWYCTEIEVFDIQQNNYWIFQINKKFEILNKEEVIFTAYPENVSEKKSKNKLFVQRISDAFHGPHMWNIVTYKDPTFSRIKRLTLMLSIFMTTYTIGLFLYGCPRLQNSDSLAYTIKYGLHAHVVLITIGCFIFTFAIHFPLIWFFRCIVIFNITLAMTLLIIFGFWVPHITGLLWLTSIIVSLLVYIFLLENFVRIINNWMIKQETRVRYILNQVKSIIAYVELQRSMLYKKFGTSLLRPFLSHLYEPLDTAKIKERKYWAEMRENILEIVEDLIMITIYVVLLYLVILKDKDPLSYLSHLEVEELVRGVHSRTIRLEEIQIRKEFEQYLRNTLIFSQQSSQWYGEYVTKNPGMTIDNVNKYIGISRLRQHRANNKTCEVPTEMRFIAEICHPGYSASPEQEDFSENWKDNKYSDKFARMDEVWKYKKPSEAGTLGFTGQFAYYPGGGYIATLGRTMKNSVINCNYLFRNRWYDESSRCILIEFLLYSPNSNLFNSITIWFEFSTTGYITSKYHVNTAKLLFVKGEIGLMIVVIFISFMIIVTMLTTKMVYRIIRKRKLVFKDVWYIVDIIIILMTVLCVFLYAQRSELVGQFLSKIERTRHNEFINYFHLLYAETVLTVLAGVLVLIATLRLWKLLRFILIIKIVEKTILISAAPLVCLILSQMVITFSFSTTGVLLFGDKSYHFQNMPHAFTSLLQISLNFLSDFDLAIINSPLAYFYYSVYMLIALVYVTIYVTVITICYAEAQVFYSNKQSYNVRDYVKEQYKYYREVSRIKWKNIRLRAGNEIMNQTDYVYPKADEHRYADCLTIPSNKMKAMSFVTKCLLRNIRRAGKPARITDQDANLIKTTIVNLFRKDSDKKYIFFMGNDENDKVKLVDDATIVKMGKIVEALTQKDKQVIDDKANQMYKSIIEMNETELSDIVENLNELLDGVNMIDIDLYHE